MKDWWVGWGQDVSARILTYFIRHPTKETYPRELERLLKISSGSISMICKELGKIRILKSRRMARVHFYKLNNENVFVRTLKSGWFVGRLDRHHQLIENPEFQSIVLYGSYARGEFNEKSDVDLLIITNMEKTKVQSLLEPLGKNLGVDLSLTIFTLAQWKELADKNDRFYKEVLANHILLYRASSLLC